MKRVSEGGPAAPTPSRKSSRRGSKGLPAPTPTTVSLTAGTPGEPLPPAPQPSLGDTRHLRCPNCPRAFECEYGAWAACPDHPELFEFAPFPPPLTRGEFALACRRLHLDKDPGAVRRYFGVNFADFDPWDRKNFVSEEIARKVTSLLTRPPDRTVHNVMSPPVGQNTKFGVRTPEKDFPTIHAAAAFFNLSFDAAYKRACRGTEGWSKITRQELSGRV